MLSSHMPHKLLFAALLCSVLVSQTHSMRYIRKAVGKNSIKTHLFQAVLKKNRTYQSSNAIHYQAPRSSWNHRTISRTSHFTTKKAAPYCSSPKVKTLSFVQKIKNWVYTLKYTWRTAKSHNPLMNSEKIKILLQQYFNDSLHKQHISFSQALHTTEQMLEREQEKLKNNYFSFYHGCSKKVYFWQYINTKLDELLYGRKPNFLLLRSRDSGFATSQQFFQEDFTNDWDYRQHLLSVNASLFGNYTNPGDCSLKYFIDSTSINDIFYPLSADKRAIYNNYKHEFEDIYEFFGKNMRGGICLQIHIKKDLVDNYTYLADSYGYKALIDAKNKPSSVLHDLHFNPQAFLSQESLENLQLRLLLTQDLLLNPYSEKNVRYISIQPWSFDQETLEEYHHKIDKLMEKIKHDIQSAKQ